MARLALLLDSLQKKFGALDDETAIECIAAIMTFRHEPPETIDAMMTRFDLAYYRASQLGAFDISNQGKAWLLLTAMRLPTNTWVTLLQISNGKLPSTDPEYQSFRNYLRRQTHLMENGPHNIADAMRGPGYGRRIAYWNDSPPEQPQQESSWPAAQEQWLTAGADDNFTSDYYQEQDDDGEWYLYAGSDTESDDPHDFTPELSREAIEQYAMSLVPQGEYNYDTGAQALYEQYLLAKRRYRRYTQRDNKMQRHHRRRKGKSKGRGRGFSKGKGPFRPHYYAGPSKGGGRKGDGKNPTDASGRRMQCFECGSEYHLKHECPRLHMWAKDGYMKGKSKASSSSSGPPMPGQLGRAYTMAIAQSSHQTVPPPRQDYLVLHVQDTDDLLDFAPPSRRPEPRIITAPVGSEQLFDLTIYDRPVPPTAANNDETMLDLDDWHLTSDFPATEQHPRFRCLGCGTLQRMLSRCSVCQMGPFCWRCHLYHQCPGPPDAPTTTTPLSSSSRPWIPADNTINARRASTQQLSLTEQLQLLSEADARDERDIHSEPIIEFTWWLADDSEPQVTQSMYLARTQLASQREGLLVDPGAQGNLVGYDWAMRVTLLAQQAGLGHLIQWKKLAKPLPVAGVGAKTQSATYEITVPIAVEGQMSTYTAPVIGSATEPSQIPALLGLQSLKQKRTILDTTNDKIHFCGPGEPTINVPPGTITIDLKQAKSTHLLVPCTDYNTVKQKDKPSRLAFETQTPSN